MSHVNEGSDPTDIALNEFVDHPSSLKIKEYFNELTEFNCLEVVPNYIGNKTIWELLLIFEFFKFLKFVLDLFYSKNLLNFKRLSL